MNQPFVINTVTVSKTILEVRQFLKNINSLVLWDAEVEPDIHGTSSAVIRRVKNAVNEEEKLTIDTQDNSIIYHFVGDKLNYEVQFVLNEVDNGTEIVENIILLETENFDLPVKLFQPILKRATEAKLLNLKRVIG